MFRSNSEHSRIPPGVRLRYKQWNDDMPGWSAHVTNPNIDFRTHPIYSYYATPRYTDGTPDQIFRTITLYWNGKRWVVWIQDIFVAEPTEFMDINDPPINWAETVYKLSRG